MDEGKLCGSSSSLLETFLTLDLEPHLMNRDLDSLYFILLPATSRHLRITRATDIRRGDGLALVRTNLELHPAFCSTLTLFQTTAK
jgi:hypothetical protein